MKNKLLIKIDMIRAYIGGLLLSLLVIYGKLR